MKPYNEYTPEEIEAFRRGELEALSVWYNEKEFAEAIRLVWADSCEGFCSCLDSDYPRNVVIADVTRAAHIAAFGAIRRAAEVARQYERDAQRPAPVDVNGEPYDVASYENWAYAIRIAIRAAIRSEKS